MTRSSAPRSSRRGLPAFAHTPSRLSHSTSAHDLRKRHMDDDDNVMDDVEDDEHEHDDYTMNGNAGHVPPVPKVPEQFRTPSRFGTPVRQSIGTNTLPASPRTPEIHYSPYAASTPPSGLSKSTSIPFDMTANDKAARKLEVELRQKKEITPTPRKKRFIRRKPFLQRISAYFQKWLDTLMLNWPPSFDTVIPAAQYANPISLGIHLLHWLLLAPLFRSRESSEAVLRTEVESRWSRFDEPGDLSRTGWKTLLITLVLIIVASANSISLFTRFRLYDMQLRSGRDTAVSPHSSPVTTPHVKQKDSIESEVNEESKTTKIMTMVLRSAWVALTWLYAGLLSVFGYGSGSLQNGLGQGYGGDTIQRLRVWEPPEFALHFFCAYPPSAPLLSHLLTPIHPFLTPLLHLITSFLLSHLARSYSQLVKDRMILSAEVMREYDQRFVYRRVFAPKVDRGVGTHEGPWYEL